MWVVRLRGGFRERVRDVPHSAASIAADVTLVLGVGEVLSIGTVDWRLLPLRVLLLILP